MRKPRVVFNLLLALFSGAAAGDVLLPDATVAFWAPFKNPNDAVNDVTPFLTTHGFIEAGRKEFGRGGLFQASFHSRNTMEGMAIVSGVASGESSQCTKVDFWFYTEEYDFAQHEKGNTRDKKAMSIAFMLASDLAEWLRASRADDVHTWQAEDNEKHYGSAVCMRSN